jgi:transposase
MPLRLSPSALQAIRTQFLTGTMNREKLSQEINVSRKTIRAYVNECTLIKLTYPDKLADVSFWLPRITIAAPPSKRMQDMVAAFPVLVDAATTPKLNIVALWDAYKVMYRDGMCLNRFTQRFIAWRRQHNVCLFSHRRVKHINASDMKTLQSWKNAFDRKKWERATAILGSYNKRPVAELVTQLERMELTILNWVDSYKENGIQGLVDRPYTLNDDRKSVIKAKQDNIIKLLHETPQLHGFNRTSWRTEDLAIAYERQHHEYICRSTISSQLNTLGYGFKKSREVLTSPDPKFREKLDNIKGILANLLPSEKFFSVDEFGHFSIKLKGGWTFGKANEYVTVPQLQKSKGCMLMTAALELSTNQVTHFYSKEKNTGEMIRLIGILQAQYRANSRLYIMWDAAPWHCSKKLRQHIQEVNDEKYRTAHGTPEIVLAPLPSSAQFLNVIESVFSGLAKAVIHNSDYQSVDECKDAIDRHFQERNSHFQKNPRKAGSKIWGNEAVKAVFDETNDCKRGFSRLK